MCNFKTCIHHHHKAFPQSLKQSHLKHRMLASLGAGAGGGSGGRKVNRRIKKYIKQGNRLMREPMGLINVETNSPKQRNKINSSSRLLKKKKRLMRILKNQICFMLWPGVSCSFLPSEWKLGESSCLSEETSSEGGWQTSGWVRKCQRFCQAWESVRKDGSTAAGRPCWQGCEARSERVS